MKVSIDFDGTLTRYAVKEFVKRLVSKKYEIHILTSRYKESVSEPNINNDLYEIVTEIGIRRDHIQFTNQEPKFKFLDENCIFHLDDDWIEIKKINKETKVKAISVFGNGNWQNDCLNLIDKFKQCETFYYVDKNGKSITKKKRVFDTLDDAIIECKKLNMQSHRINKVVSYKCRKCFKYHIGRNGKGIKK